MTAVSPGSLGQFWKIASLFRLTTWENAE